MRNAYAVDLARVKTDVYMKHAIHTIQTTDHSILLERLLPWFSITSTALSLTSKKLSIVLIRCLLDWK